MSLSLLALQRYECCRPSACGRLLHILRHALGHADCSGLTSTATDGRVRHQLAQQLQSLCRRAWPAENANAGDIAARPIEAGDEAALDRIVAAREDDRNRRGCRLGRQRRRRRRQWRRSRPPGGEPDRPPAPATDRIDPPPSGIRSRRCGPRRSRLRSGLGGTRPRDAGSVEATPLLRNPITGIVGCCARAASGHAAAPPSSVMNSRRLIRSPRRRGRATIVVPRGRAPWRS